MQQPMGQAEQTAMSNQQQQQHMQQQMQQQQMQQQINQQQMQQQINQQQQMVLCPVRVVYETQILMPPGEQMQPNQTFFVNPQNQPPWANQSTPMYPQNQVLYVQQMPNNMVAAAQPTIDQNHIQYIQQAYPNMQQVVANPNIITQSIQDRQVLRQPVQYGNMNLMSINQYGQVINMPHMANITSNVPNIIQSPMNQNIQLMQNPATPSKPPETQQQSNINFLRNHMQQTQQAQQTMIRQNVPQQQVISRGVQPNMSGSSIQIQQNLMQQIQPKANVVPQQNQIQVQQNNVQQQNIQKQVNIQPGVQSHVQTQVNMAQMQQPKQIVSAQQNVTGSPIQIMPSMNQQTCQQRQMNLPPTNQVVVQANMQQNTQQKQNIAVSLSQMPSNQNYPQRQNVQQNTGQFNQQPQPNRSSPSTSVRQQYPLNQNFDQQRQNMGSPQQRNTFTQQYPKMLVRQATPMDYTPVISSQSSTVTTAVSQTRPTANAKIGIPLHGIPNRPPQNSSPQIRSKIAPSPNTGTKAPLSHQQVRNIPQLRPTGNHSLMQMQNMMSVNPIQNTPRPLVTSQITKSSTSDNHCITLNNTSIDNRKRKSESPDECRNKVSINMVNQLVFNKSLDNLKPSELKKTDSDVAVNTNLTTNLINTNFANNFPMQTNKEIAKETLDQKAEKMDIDTDNNETVRKPIHDINHEKLVRNTVFAQAKSRNISISSNESKTVELNDKEINVNELKSATISDDSKIETMKVDQIKKEIIDNPVEIKPQHQEVITKKEESVKTESVPTTKHETTPEIKSDSQTDEEKIQRISDFLGKEIELSHGNIKKRDGNENNYILTHVLDGIVIQESNVAFPIRLPLKEKILSNARIANSDVPKTETKVEEIETKTNDAKIVSTISKLNLEEKESIESDDNDNKYESDVFSSLTSKTIKTWTAEELATYLAKKGWLETASILQDNEIDGEALFLVSNAQLLDIGINENHALLLSNFVKS